MGDKKHIDRLFQERFKDFETAPNDAVWESIEAKLKQDKKKRRVIPIWWQYAGVAAVLALLLTIGGMYFFNETHNNNPIKVVETEDSQTRSSNTENNTKIAVENDENAITILEKDSKQPLLVPAVSNDASQKPSIVSTTSPGNKNENNHPSGLASKEISNIDNSNKPRNNYTVAKNSEETNKSLNAGGEPNSESKKESFQNKESIIHSEKAKKLIDNTTKDHVAVAKNDNKEKNALTIEEVLDKTKDNIAEEKNANKWRIAPNAAPVYFNTLGEGSSIDSQFNSNSKTGEFNMSYGINASYAINDKLKVRSGINKVNLGYNTNNVIVYQSVGFSSSTKALENIDASSASVMASDNISIISGENLNAAPSSFETINTSINQAFGYIEIPLEIEYALVNKKIGINVIGGFSSFFLSENKIFSEAEGGSKTYLGEANNINNVSYSANFGFGLNYQVSKKIDLNVEPMFKYQINTFNNTSGDFKPYFIGVYTGFAIKF